MDECYEIVSSFNGVLGSKLFILIGISSLDELMHHLGNSILAIFWIYVMLILFFFWES